MLLISEEKEKWKMEDSVFLFFVFDEDYGDYGKNNE